MSRKKNDGLITKVIDVKTVSDEDGTYIIYCHSGWHKGVSQTPEICELRDCRHKERFYVLLNHYDRPQ